MNDLAPINLPARIVRATWQSEMERQRAAHHKDSAWDQAAIGLLYAALAAHNAEDGRSVIAVLFCIAVIGQAVLVWLNLRARKRAMRKADALFDLTFEHAVNHTIKPWPEEDA